eukprot:s638_g16.t1
MAKSWQCGSSFRRRGRERSRGVDKLRNVFNYLPRQITAVIRNEDMARDDICLFPTRPSLPQVVDFFCCEATSD